MPEDEGAAPAAPDTLFDIREYVRTDATPEDPAASQKTVTVNVKQTSYQRRPPTRRPKEAQTIEERLREGRAARDKSVASIASNVDQSWVEYMLGLVERLARERPRFASFDLTDLYDRDRSPSKPPPPHDNRAVGVVMQTAQRKGFITPTNDFVPTPVKEHHAAPKRVWRSLIFEGRPEQ